MGTFDTRAAMDDAYATGEDRIAVLLDGRPAGWRSAPAAPAPDATPAPKADAPAVPAGPGFWDRLADSFAGVGKRLAQVTTRPGIDAAQANAAAQQPARPSRAPLGLILGAAAAVVAVAMIVRRP